MANWDEELNRVRAQVKGIAGLPKLTAKRAAKKIEGLIAEEFDRGADPYGNAWEPLAESTIARGRTNPPLTDTGDMRGSVQVTVYGTDIVASVDDPFPYHQAGTANMPARPILPTGATPDSWVAAVDESVDEELQAYEIFRRTA